MADRPTIFVSYARVDRAAAQAVVEALRHAGLTVWWDADIPQGAEWQEVLQERLGACSACLVLIGTQGVSGWVRAEVGVALSRHFARNAAAPMDIVPVLLDGAVDDVVPPFLALFQIDRLDDARDPVQIGALVEGLRDGIFRAYRTLPLPPEIARCPFPGLAPFQREHRGIFLGRHTDLLDALDRFSRHRADGGRSRWLRIEGDSGVGKSSLLRAGLVPALENGWLDLGAAGSGLRLLGVMRPGQSPLFTLAGVLARAFELESDKVEARLRGADFRLAHLFAEHLPEDRRELPLLVVDQLEELFTLTRDRDEDRMRFDALLAEALGDPSIPLYLVTTMRSDFLGQFEAAPRLDARRNDAARYELLPMGEAGLRDVVIRGIQLAGLRYSDDTLPEDIIDEARNERGALPLVSNLLRLLCEHGDGVLQRERYNVLGKLGGALSHSADGLLESLGPAKREKALRLLLALVEPGVNTANSRRSITRRRALASMGGGDEARDVLDRLSGHSVTPRAESDPVRLLMIDTAQSNNADEDSIDLIHETLIQASPRGEPYWPTLWNRIGKQDFLDTRSRLEQQARAWQRRPDTVPLAQGKELRAFEHHREGADAQTLAYLDASVRRRRRIRAVMLPVAVLVLAGAALAADGAWWLHEAAKDPKTINADWSTVLVRWRNLLGRPALPEMVPLPPAGKPRCFLRRRGGSGARRRQRLESSPGITETVAAIRTR